MSNDKIEIPDVMASSLVHIINDVHAKGALITNYVVLIEAYDVRTGKKRFMVAASPESTQYQVFGMINYANQTFEYHDVDPDEDDDSDYNPDWHKNQ